MAKRKTLRKQRDKALAELKEYKDRFVNCLHQAFKHSDYERRVRRFCAENTAPRGLFEDRRFLPTETEMIRRLLHGLVDKGLLDSCIKKYAEYDHVYDTVKNRVEIEVIQPEENYDQGIFNQIWQNNEHR